MKESLADWVAVLLAVAVAAFVIGGVIAVGFLLVAR